MSHPFEVDKTYRNRTGEYVVQAIEGDSMIIRYVGGSNLTTRASLQARIWENIQFEEQMAREEERRKLAQEARQAARRRAAQAKKLAAAPKFGGFEESDFEPKKRGLAWSTRGELGKKIAYDLTQQTESDFGHWIVPRKSAVHVGRKGKYDRDARDQNAAFFIAVDQHGVSFGFRLGNPGGKNKAAWPISSFFTLLSKDSKERRSLRATMKKYDLSLDVYAMDVRYEQVGQITIQDRGFLWQHETPEQESTQRMNWSQVSNYLQTLAPKKQSDLFVRKHLTSEQALEAGAGIVAQLLEVVTALLPAYDVIVKA